MTANSHPESEPRTVETAWAETLTDELPIDETGQARAYADFLFGIPAFTMGSVDPDSAVVLVDQLLDRYTPMTFFDVQDALTTAEWADLKESLVVQFAEGVDGERPGPAGSFPDVSESVSDQATGVPGPAGTESPGGPAGPSASPMTGRGFAADAPDLDDIDTPTTLARAVSELVEAADLPPDQARQALELVLADLGEGTDDG
jgi:hypothetical protein